jgi:hypothetical protein
MKSILSKIFLIITLLSIFSNANSHAQEITTEDTKNSTSSEFTSTTSLSIFSTNSTTTNLNNITKYIGNINNQNRYQQFIFNNLDKSKQSLILYTLVSSSTNKSYPVTITVPP